MSFDVGLERSADSLNEVLDEGSMGSAEPLFEEHWEDGLDVSADSLPRPLYDCGKHLASIPVGVMRSASRDCCSCCARPAVTGVLAGRL